MTPYEVIDMCLQFDELEKNNFDQFKNRGILCVSLSMEQRELFKQTA